MWLIMTWNNWIELVKKLIKFYWGHIKNFSVLFENFIIKLCTLNEMTENLFAVCLDWNTRRNQDFTVCQRHMAKLRRHMAKSSPSVANGEPLTAALDTAKA